MKGTEYWRHIHFPLNHDSGRKGTWQDAFPKGNSSSNPRVSGANCKFPGGYSSSCICTRSILPTLGEKHLAARPSSRGIGGDDDVAGVYNAQIASQVGYQRIAVAGSFGINDTSHQKPTKNCCLHPPPKKKN